MIHIKRNPGTPSLDVFNKNTKKASNGKKVPWADEETERMIAFYSKKKNFKDEKKVTRTKNPEYKAYKDKDLVKLLLKIFHEKCAYCESRFPATSNQDIEHFRPKGRIDTENGRLLPGYYWLGANWNNLLVSCSLCNRRQFHESPDATDQVKLGKADLFPLADDAKRIRRHTDDVAAEEPFRMLIHPCLEKKPESFFEFDKSGNIRPANQRGKNHDRAIASIETYALQRKPLVDDRAKEHKQVKFQLRRMRDRVEDFNDAISTGIDNKISRAKEQLAFEVDAICTMFAIESPFLAMKRKLLKASLDANELGDFSKAGIDLSDLLVDFELTSVTPLVGP